LEHSGSIKSAAVMALVGDAATDILDRLPRTYSLILREQMDAAIPTDPVIVGKIVKEALAAMEQIQPGITDVMVPKKQNEFIEDVSNEFVLDQELGDDSLFADDEVVPEVMSAEPEPEPEIPAPLFDIGELSEQLKNQRPQVLAFLMSRMQDDLKAQILAQLPKDQVTHAMNLSVEPLPISEKVFSKLYKTLLN
jgi:flagellar motor switch protein FliG